MTKVIGILGTTQADGLTAQMMQAVLAGANASGCSVSTIRLNEKRLQLDNDPMHRREIRDIGKELLSADCLVLASPTYWGSVSGLMKNFLDCMQSELIRFTAGGDRLPDAFEGKRYVLITTCFKGQVENLLTGVTDGTFAAMDLPLRTAGMVRIGELVFTGTWHYRHSMLPLKKRQECEFMGRQIEKKVNQGGHIMKRYIELFFMLAATILAVMGLEQALSMTHLIPLNNFWINYLVFVLLAYLLLAGCLHFFADLKHRRH
jgi:multimeric flavodoxin WrbA